MSENESLKIELLKACGGDVAAADAALEWVRPTRTVVAPVSLKPKTVEVWRVEYTQLYNGKWMPLTATYETEAEARDIEGAYVKDGTWKCVHVTGPHKQTVPAT